MKTDIRFPDRIDWYTITLGAAILGLISIFGCAEKDYGAGQQKDQASLDCPNCTCEAGDCPNCNCPDYEATDCPSCPSCPSCPTCPTAEAEKTFYIHDCMCLNSTETYYCSTAVCARNEAESIVFGEMVCGIMFSYYDEYIGYCECENLYGEVCL